MEHCQGSTEEATVYTAGWCSVFSLENVCDGLEKNARLKGSRCRGSGAVGSHAVDRDLGELEGVGSLSARLPLDPSSTL